MQLPIGLAVVTLEQTFAAAFAPCQLAEPGARAARITRLRAAKVIRP